VGTSPVFIASGQGAYLTDIDGNNYLDYVGSWGPALLGHAVPEVVVAVSEAASRGLSYGAPTLAENELAAEVLAAYPSMEQLRMVCSGTEATMSALRLARAANGGELIVKFEGCYHGHADGLLVKAGSGALTAGVPTSDGVPLSIAATTLVARYNDLSSVQALFDRYGAHIAAVIVEPVVGNMGVVLPAKGFLEGLRAITATAGSLLIFDEVMTGFRVAYGGAQDVWGIDPDITCLGKIVGGGLPAACYGGKARYMELVAPKGSVYQAGTLAGNPLAMAAGLATLALLKREGVYDELAARTERLAVGIARLGVQTGVPVRVNWVPGMFTVFFTENPVESYEQAVASDTERYARYYRFMLQAGIYLPPSQFEAAFVSLALSEEDIAHTLSCVEDAFYALG
jgi:glutamate-1-semialdehyde 2,1-aminomutase